MLSRSCFPDTCASRCRGAGHRDHLRRHADRQRRAGEYIQTRRSLHRSAGDERRNVYRQSCASCHGAALTGGAAPPLAGPGVRRSWDDPASRSTTLLHHADHDAAASVGRVVGAQTTPRCSRYILKSNGYRVGRVAADRRLPELKQRASSDVSAPAHAAPPHAAAGLHPRRRRAPPPRTAGPDQATLTAAARSTDWLFHNHDYAGTRYSPLDEITPRNASRLAPACMFQMGERDNFQTGPIVHNGTMYVTTMTSTIALDAATCRVKWRHTLGAEGRHGGWQRNRGVAIKDGRVVRGTPDGYLLALERRRPARCCGRGRWRSRPRARRSRWRR